MGTDCKSAAFSFGGSNPPAPTKNSSIRTGYWSFCFICYTKGTQGWIRTASTRRTVRRGKKPLRGFFRCVARVIHPRPPRTPVSEPGYWSFCFICLEKGDARVDSNSTDPQSSGCSGHNPQIYGKSFVKMANRHFISSAVSQKHRIVTLWRHYLYTCLLVQLTCLTCL